MAYHDKYKKILDEIWKDKVELDGKIVKEDEEAVKRIKGEALKEKDDPGAFIFPIRLEGKVNENALADTGSDINTMPYRIFEMLGREDMKKIDRGITMINHTQAETMGKLSNVLCQVGFEIKEVKEALGSDMGHVYKLGRDVEKLVISIDRLRELVYFSYTSGTHDGEARLSRSKLPRQHETVEELLLPQVHHKFLIWEGCSREAKSRYNTKFAQLLPRHIYLPCVVNWDVLNQMGCDGEIDDMLRIRLREAESDGEIFTLVAWIRAFNINEPIYAEICHEFYSTYEFDEVLGLYQVVELEEEGFNVYFEGGLPNDDNFNAQDYWLSISREDNRGLSRSHTSTIRNLILRVIHKMTTYGLCQRMTGYDKIQKNDLWLLSMFDARHQNGGQFISKLARKCRVLTEDVGVPRVGIPRPPRASMQDLYDRMGRMEILQDAIERMEYRQSYH
ncbi:hypothetical protein Tco_0595109 [Tanacetum coccineum]